MQDRQSTNPGRVKFTLDDGTVMYGKMERADSPTVVGTPLNKSTIFNQKNTDRFIAETPAEAFELIGRVWGPIKLVASGWSLEPDGYYIQTVVVDGMSEQYFPSKIPIYTSAEMKDNEKVAHSMVDIIETLNGAIIAKATDIPDIDIIFLLTGV